jgi:hypothetical protein
MRPDSFPGMTLMMMLGLCWQVIQSRVNEDPQFVNLAFENHRHNLLQVHRQHQIAQPMKIATSVFSVTHHRHSLINHQTSAL